jgi:hypothetical protein
MPGRACGGRAETFLLTSRNALCTLQLNRVTGKVGTKMASGLSANCAGPEQRIRRYALSLTFASLTFGGSPGAVVLQPPPHVFFFDPPPLYL